MIKGSKTGNDLFLKSPLQDMHLSLNLRRQNKKNVEVQDTGRARFHMEKALSKTSPVLRHLWTSRAILGKGVFDETPQGLKG